MSKSQFNKANECLEIYEKTKDKNKLLEAVKYDIDIFQNIKIEDQFKDICSYVISKQPDYIQLVKIQSNDLVELAIKKDPMSLKFIKKQTKKIIMLALSINALSIACVKKQTHDLCLYAVKQTGTSLYFIKNKTYDICLEAVKQNGYALRYVPYNIQDYKIVKTALKNNSSAIEFAAHSLITEEDFISAIKNNIRNFKFSNLRSRKISLAFLKNYKDDYYDDPMGTLTFTMINKMKSVPNVVLENEKDFLDDKAKIEKAVIEEVIKYLDKKDYHIVLKNINVLKYFPKDMQSKRICRYLFDIDPSYSKYFRKDIIDYYEDMSLYYELKIN